VGADGSTHQGLFDLSYLRMVPNLSIMAPRDEAEFVRMLRTAIGSGKVAAIRYPRGAVAGVPVTDGREPIPWGRGEMLCDGKDLLILGIGATVHPAFRAAEELRTRGISAAVIDARFVKPLDAGLIRPVAQRIGKVLTVEENVLAGGFGSAVLEMLEEHGDHPQAFRRIGIRDTFVEHGSQAVLREAYGLTSEAIVAEAVRLCAHGRAILPSILNGIRSRLEKIV